MTKECSTFLYAVAVAAAMGIVAHGQSRAASARSYVARGDSFLEHHDARRAMDDYNLALAFDERSAEAWNNRGLARELAGDAEGALGDFSHALALAPREPKYLANRGRLQLLRGDLNGALADLDQAVAIAPKLAEAWATRGLVWGAREDPARAIADFDRALRLNPRLLRPRFNRGLALLMQGRRDEAAREFETYRKLGGTLTPEQEQFLQAFARRER